MAVIFGRSPRAIYADYNRHMAAAGKSPYSVGVYHNANTDEYDENKDAHIYACTASSYMRVLRLMLAQPGVFMEDDTFCVEGYVSS